MGDTYQTSLNLPPVLRAAVVRGYRDAFRLASVAKKPRPISFETAMRIRASWICGTSDKHLADQHFKGRTDSLRPLLSGTGYMAPTGSELAGAETAVNAFYSALDACTFAPVGAAVPGYLLPLEQYAMGAYVAPMEETSDEPEEYEEVATVIVDAGPVKAATPKQAAPADPHAELWAQLVTKHKMAEMNAYDRPRIDLSVRAPNPCGVNACKSEDVFKYTFPGESFSRWCCMSCWCMETIGEEVDPFS